MATHTPFYLHHLCKHEPELPQHHHKDSTLMDPHHLILTQYLLRRPSKPTLLRLFFLFSLISCTLVFFFHVDDTLLSNTTTTTTTTICSSVPNNTICCDRTAFRTDICFLRGDIRTHSSTASILLHLLPNTTTPQQQKIRPYTRKWEPSTMSTIDELTLLPTTTTPLPCDVQHHVPAIVFSTGGYTGNVYHEFNDGILPLYITAQKYNRRVVIVLLEYHDWWMTKYADVLSRISDFPPIDFTKDTRTHCFPEATVGLRIHDELAIEPALMEHNKTIVDFRNLIDDAYRPRVEALIQHDEEEEEDGKKSTGLTCWNPKLVIVSRKGSRAIENEREAVRVAEEVGFRVEVLRPKRSTELAKVYRTLNSSDAMVGVHGAAMTHLLFMRPRSVFIQVVPLGTDWAAETYYGEPAMKLGLKYMRYKVLPRESSLYRLYKRDDPVLRDPDSVNAKGWELTKKVYLDGQNVKLDINRFRKRLVKAHQYLVAKKKQERS